MSRNTRPARVQKSGNIVTVDAPAGMAVWDVEALAASAAVFAPLARGAVRMSAGRVRVRFTVLPAGQDQCPECGEVKYVQDAHRCTGSAGRWPETVRALR